MTAAPKLSVVAATRNDEHGGNQMARTQLFINGLAEQALRFKLPVELLLVEWNPPPDRPSLAEALSWPRSEWFAPRIVVVSPELHARFPQPSSFPLGALRGELPARQSARRADGSGSNRRRCAPGS